MSYPVFLSRFIGRKNELSEIKSLIRERSVRLLTLTGPGGCGKTRLANEVLTEISGTFEDGMAWVDLVGISHAEALPQALGTALEVRPAPGQSMLGTLIGTLQQRETLIVLDNCEHLIEASARLADALLRACPELRLLATSRQKLGVEGEQVWPVPPLSYPAEDLPPLDAALAYDALQLFSARARQVNPKFEINSGNISAVVKIARILEGMPLAIELAAARVNLLDLPHMAERLENQLALLAGAGSTTDLRHQSMREAIHWSYDLLSADEKVLFQRLGVFASGFSLEAAEAVCSAAPLAETQILDLLGKLIDKSLVIRAGDQPAGSRYRLLESIRQYAGEIMRAAGEESLMRDRHLAYFANLVREAEPHLLGSGQLQWTEMLEADYDNLQAALAYAHSKALEGQGSKQEAVSMMNGLYWFWNYTDRHAEAKNWYEQILALPGLEEDSFIYADLTRNMASFVWLLGDYPAARAQLQHSLEIAEAIDYAFGIAHVKLMLGIMSLHQGKGEQATGLLRESERLFKTLDEPRGLVITYTNLGGVFLGSGDLNAAREYAEKAVQIARSNQDVWGLGMSLSGLGNVLYRQGELGKALGLMEEALDLLQSSGQQWLRAEALWRLGEMRRDQGDSEQAEKLLEGCYELAQETGAMEWQVAALESLGFLALGQGNQRQAAGHFSKALHLTAGQAYEQALAHIFLGVVQLSASAGDWERAVTLWRAYERLKESNGLPPFKEERLAFELLQPHLKKPTLSRVRQAGVAEAASLALQITQGFEQRMAIIPSEYVLRLLALGPTEVYLRGRMLAPSDWTFAKPKELLYYLISNPPRTKEQIGLVFWPDASPNQLRASLRATLYHLRRALGERGWVLYEDGYYKFNRSMDYWYDVEAFEAGLKAAQQAGGTDEQAIGKLEAAVCLYRGDFLADLAHDEWGALRREELHGKYLGAMNRLGDLLVRNGAYERAIEVYRSLLATDTLMEAAHQALMRCYALKGERLLAIRQYKRLVEVMEDELGVPPSPETTALYQSLRQERD